MQVKLPPVWTLQTKLQAGVIRCMELPSTLVECTTRVQYTRERDRGHALAIEGLSRPLLLFTTKPGAAYAADEYVLVSADVDWNPNVIDLTQATWCRHPQLPEVPPSAVTLVRACLESWRDAFRFAVEEPGSRAIGLRKPQVGALHAIHAHWSITNETATVVMPTGTGKTDTMVSVLTSARCPCVLVIVPTDPLRAQISEKFETLGILKADANAILSAAARRPVVGTLTSRPRSVEDVEAFFQSCNVVVTTSQLIGGCTTEVQTAVSERCSHLFIDEAHHAEAPTWKRFRARFKGKPVLQFTATPFREDDQKVDGKLVYVYPLRMAQQEGYFRPIHFRGVFDIDRERGDRKIAEAALDALDDDVRGRRIAMARVANIGRATGIHQLYQSLGRHEAVVLHSGLSQRNREAAKQKLLSGQARIVVCVDMLGEGFDLPELKIAAFHDIKKSLAVTLQLAGRFTRSQQDLGDAVFIANTALIDVDEELRKLYSQDPDWNALLPELSSTAIEGEVAAQQFFSGFETLPEAIPLNQLRPAASMVVYHTNCPNWTPRRFARGLHGLTARDRVCSSLNERENTLVILVGKEELVKWTDAEAIQEWRWELFLAVWDRDLHLLYLHGANNDGDYKSLAKAVCGDDVRIVVEPHVYRCFHGVKRIVLNNVGLDQHLGRQVRYVGHMGSDVEDRISQSARQTATRAVLAGKGFEKGTPTSIGAAKRGRVWSHQRLRVDTFAGWARRIGAKLVDDDVDPNTILEGTLKPRIVDSVPQKATLGVEWPSAVYERPEDGTLFVRMGAADEALTYVDVDLIARADDDPVVVRVFGDGWESRVRLRIFASGQSFDFEFEQEGGTRVEVRQGAKLRSLATFFTEHPPVVWFADGSSLEGARYIELPGANQPPYPRDWLDAWDWTGVDITRESQGEARASNTIQYQTIQRLQTDASYRVIFDDDDAGEAADIVAIRTTEAGERRTIEVEFYHCKFSSQPRPGARVDDLYVVCGQAQRSVSWLATHARRTELFVHLLKRESKRTGGGRGTRYERGDDAVLAEIRELSRRSDVKLKAFIVQPGLSRANASLAQLQLLAVTERYLTETYEVPLRVICSA